MNLGKITSVRTTDCSFLLITLIITAVSAFNVDTIIDISSSKKHRKINTIRTLKNTDLFAFGKKGKKENKK